MKKTLKIINQFNCWREYNRVAPFWYQTIGLTIICAALMLFTAAAPVTFLFFLVLCNIIIITEKLARWLGFDSGRQHLITEMPRSVLYALSYIYKSQNFKRWDRRQRAKAKKATSKK